VKEEGEGHGKTAGRRPRVALSGEGFSGDGGGSFNPSGTGAAPAVGFRPEVKGASRCSQRGKGRRGGGGKERAVREQRKGGAATRRGGEGGARPDRQAAQPRRTWVARVLAVPR
jgi:hypothetical protein